MMALARATRDWRSTWTGAALLAIAACSDGSGPAEETAPGRPIAFIGRVETFDHLGEPGIYTVGADGRGLRRLTADTGQALFPAWSPDGRRLAFVRGNRIWTMDAAGATQALVAGSAGACRYTYAHPSWAPDGARLAAECSGDTHVIDLAGGASYSLSQRLGRVAAHPDWSPDGRRILFTSGAFDIPSGAYTATPDGQQFALVTEDVADPAWSPDGRRIAFVARTGPADALALFVANADGSDRRAITFPDTSFFDEGPVWSPDGQWIAFHRNGPAVCQGAAPLQPRRCLPHWRLFVIRPDGRELRPLTPDSLQATWPDW